MKFTISQDGYDYMHTVHKDYNWKFTHYLKMWDFYGKVRQVLIK